MTRDYKKGQIVLYQGEVADRSFRIKKGYVKAYDVTVAGTEKLIMLLGPGDIFPLLWSIEKPIYLHYFYETFTDCELQLIDRKEMLSALKSDHEITLSLLEYFVGKSTELMRRVECIEGTSAKHKVAQVMLYLAAAHGEPYGKSKFKISLPITHSVVASMAGITRETASLQIGEMQKDKLISNDKVLVVYCEKIEDFLSQ